MKHKFLFILLFSLVLEGMVTTQAVAGDYVHQVNTLIGTKGTGLTSGYLYPGATYPYGMVQFTPSYFSKRSGFVINQLSGGGCEHMGNFPTFPVKGKLKMLYASYGSYLLVLFKFLLAFLVFEEINRLLPYVEGLDQIFVVLLASLICSIMPWNLMVFLGMGLIVGQCYGIGIEIAGFALALIVIMVILYLRFTPQDALVLLLTPVAFSFGVPCLIPIGYGLTRTPSSAISAGFGVILYYFMELVSDNASVLTGADKEEKIQNLQFLSDGLMKNQEMMVTIIAFVTVLVIVYVVRRLEVEYAWHIAVFGGGIAYMIIMAAGGIFLEATIPVVPLVAGTMVSVFVGEILEFFFFHVDYKRTERLQFEDDEYYYYVKAIPKVAMTTPEKTVKKINERQETEIIDAEAVKRLSQDTAEEETKAIDLEVHAGHGLKREAERKPSYGDADYRSPAQIRASQARKHSPKRGPAPKKHDMKDVDKMLLTQSLENEFHAGNRRKR